MFGEILKNLMDENNITQTALAEKIGYTQRAVSKWINNQAEPTETAIRNCATFFNVSSDYLLGLDDDDRPKKNAPKYHIGTLNNNGGTVDLK